MQLNDLWIQSQIQELTLIRRRCLESRESLLQVRRRLAVVAEQESEGLSRLTAGADERLKSGTEQIFREAASRLEQATADAASQRMFVRQSLQHRLDELNASHLDEVNECRQKLQNEVWVLQSVCDEEHEDTPVRHAERQHEIYVTQQSFLDQQLQILKERVQGTAEFLEACHAGMESTLPPPSMEFKGRDASREVTLKSIDQALMAVGQVERMRLAQWVFGWRLSGLGLFVFVVVTGVVTALRADLTQYVNPELGRPDWKWLGVSSLIGFGAAFLTGMLLLLTVQSRLRSRFDAVLQYLANASAGSDYWRQKSRQELKRLESAAESWKVSMMQRREQHSGKLRSDTESRIASLTANHNEQVAKQSRACDEALRRIEGESAHQQKNIEVWQQQELSRLRTRVQSDLEQSTVRLREETIRDRASLSEQERSILQDWSQQLGSALEIARLSQTAVRGVPRWSQLKATDWQPPVQLPQHLPVGDLLVSIPECPESAVDEANRNLCIEVPALLRFPRDTSVIVEHDISGREQALEFVRSLMLRLLTSILPGRVQFTLIDPVGLGQSFSAMMHLADFDELLISNRIWTDATQIRERLQKVTEHMERIFQTYLRSDFATIEEYNAAAGEVAEPYHFVVIAGFPVSFTEEAARALTSIMTSGPRCGVHTIITWSPEQSLPRSFEVATLRNCSVAFRVKDGRVQPADGTVDFDAAVPPAAPDYVSLVRAVGERSRNARRVEVAFSRIAPKADEVWTHSSADGLDIPIGRAGAARLQYMRLGRGTSQHVLVAGKTGSGKSTLLHILITNLALYYSPDEIQFFLIDFKKGVEFRTYAANQLPHARVVAIESDREFGLSVLERLDEILQERGELFRIRGVQDVPSFRRMFRNEKMPRLLLLIDEFQEFFTSEDRVSSRASLLLDRLIRQGRAFGIHVLLGSQTLGGAYSLARSTLGQVAVRIALQCSESDAHLILSEENSAARLLTRPGEAIYNDANGMIEGNHPFQIAWLEEEQREAMIASLIARPDFRLRSDARMIVFEGNVPPSIEQCGPLNAWLGDEPDATRHFVDTLPVWIGEPVAIAAPVCIEFRRSGGQNVLIVGQESDLADAILAAMITSAATVHRNDGVRTSRMMLLHDGLDRLSQARMAELFPAEIAPRFSLHEPAETTTVITGLAAMLTERENGQAPPDSPEVILAIRNLGQFRSLRRDDDEYGLSGFGTPKQATVAGLLGDLIRRGPLVGIHVVIWADTFNNAMRWLSNSLLREFDNRIAFRLNQTDSASLIDTPAAASLTQGRAILYRDQTGTADRFRPFSWPDSGWLRSFAISRGAGASRSGDSSTLNIDELTIE